MTRRLDSRAFGSRMTNLIFHPCGGSACGAGDGGLNQTLRIWANTPFRHFVTFSPQGGQNAVCHSRAEGSGIQKIKDAQMQRGIAMCLCFFASMPLNPPSPEFLNSLQSLRNSTLSPQGRGVKTCLLFSEHPHRLLRRHFPHKGGRFGLSFSSWKLWNDKFDYPSQYRFYSQTN